MVLKDDKNLGARLPNSEGICDSALYVMHPTNKCAGLPHREVASVRYQQVGDMHVLTVPVLRLMEVIVEELPGRAKLQQLQNYLGAFGIAEATKLMESHPNVGFKHTVVHAGDIFFCPMGHLMLEHVANNAVVEGFKFGICWANRAVLDNWKAVCSITQTQDDASAEREAISDQLSKALGVKPPRSAGDEEEKKQEAEVASAVAA